MRKNPQGAIGVKSIYEQALGERFYRLHPKLQEKFGLTSEMNRTAIASGVMEEISGGHPLLRPCFILGTPMHIVFPERGKDIPFTLTNVAYRVAEGKEMFAWLREFHFPKAVRRFDAVMWYDGRRNVIIDAFGTQQNFVSVLHMDVREDGGIRIVSERQWLRIFGLNVPIPKPFRGEAEIHEWYNDEAEAFSVHVHVRNPLAGTLFEYRGSFKTEYVTQGGEHH